jgi:hypothetical protein
MELDVKQLLQLPKMAVIALINDQDKVVHITHSSCVVESLGKLIRQLKDKTHNNLNLIIDREKLRFVVLEEIQNIDALGVKTRYWVDQYVAKGYGLYGKINAVKYRLRVEYDDYARVIVKAVNTRNKGYVIGVFRNLGLANQWIENTFKDKEYIIPQYANNELTKSYLKQYEIQRLGSYT